MDVETIAINGEWTRHAPHRSDPLGRAAEATDRLRRAADEQHHMTL